jgi:hypothetical protein
MAENPVNNENQLICCKQCFKCAKISEFSKTKKNRVRYTCTVCLEQRKAVQKMINNRYQRSYQRKQLLKKKQNNEIVEQTQQLHIELTSTNKNVDLSKMDSLTLKF